MSNQTLLWSSFIISWLSVIFLKKEDLKRYMPVALFGALLSTIIIEAGTTLNWWSTKETVFPLINMPIFIYGSFLVGILWIFKFSYKRFWLFLATNACIDLILIIPLDNWFVRRGILELNNITPLQMLFLSIVHATLLYSYQLWQEGEASPFKRLNVNLSSNVQSAASKPLRDDHDEE